MGILILSRLLSACVTACCPCITLYMVADRLNESALIFGLYDCCACWCGCFLMHVIFTTLLRRRVRQRFRIKGDTFDDYLWMMICTDCGQCQMYNELARRGYLGSFM